MALCVSTVFGCGMCIFRERGGGWLVGGGFARRAHMIRARHVN